MSIIKFAFTFFLGALVITAPMRARAVQCADLFAVEFAHSSQSPRDFFFDVAKFESSHDLARAFRADWMTAANPVFDVLVAPGIWNIARLTLQQGPAIDRGVTDWISQIQKQAMDEARSRDLSSRENARPRAMTGDERKLAIELGNYSAIDGARLPVSRAQRDREAFRGLLIQAQAAHEKKNRNELLETFNRVLKNSGGEVRISKSQVQTVLKNPVDFAIAYAGLNGLMYYAGEAGMMLSPLVPWVGRVDAATANSLRDMAMMARASITDAAARRSADNLVLEVLRREFASHLDPTLDVGPSR